MITRAQYSFVEDISRANPVLRISRAAIHLSAAVWTTPRTGSMAAARLECLRYAAARVVSKLPLWRLWLIVGHRAPQPDNRITRYRAIWGSLKSQGVDLPPAAHFEHIGKSEQGLRVFGAAALDLAHLEWAHRVMSTERAAVIITPEQGATGIVTDLLQRGWALQNSKPPQELLEPCIDHMLIVMDLYGEFDDPDVSAAAIGRREIVIDLNT